MGFSNSKYDHQKAIERIDAVLNRSNTSLKDIIPLERPIIPSNLIKSEWFYENNSILSIFIKLNFHETKVPLLKYKCCISEINAALLADTLFKIEDIHTVNNFIFSTFTLWSFYKEPRFIYSFNEIKVKLFSTILKVSSIIDILNVKFKINGHSNIGVKIGISCRKIKEAEKLCLLCPDNAKIMLDNYAFEYIRNFLDKDNKALLNINSTLDCYEGNLINKEMNEWVKRIGSFKISEAKANSYTSSNARKSNIIATHDIESGYHKTTIKSTICPVCDGDGGTRGGCYKCGGTGWVTEKAKSNYYPSPEGSHGRSDESRISNYSYIGGHIGANYRDRDGSIGSIPEYDEDN